jgi:uncharacterized protein (TIGR02246 family)
MTGRIALGMVATLALGSPLPALAQGGESVRSQIEKLDKEWEKAFNAGDAAAIAKLYGQDAKLLVPGAKPAAGRSAIQAAFQEAVKQGAKNTVTLEDVVTTGNYAIETGNWVATRADGKHLDHGPYVTVYKKEGGAWKIYRDIWNSSMNNTGKP